MEYEDFDIFENLKELEFDTLGKLNNKLIEYNCSILSVNIRRLNANIALLESYIESLSNRPKIIICTETGSLVNINLYNIPGYRIYYNNGEINIADGVVIYVDKQVQHDVKTLNFNGFKVLNCMV